MVKSKTTLSTVDHNRSVPPTVEKKMSHTNLPTESKRHNYGVLILDITMWVCMWGIMDHLVELLFERNVKREIMFYAALFTLCSLIFFWVI
jgi:hypothetical protein